MVNDDKLTNDQYFFFFTNFVYYSDNNNDNKYCGFCHCGLNSTLGQGDFWLFKSSIGLNSCKKYLTQLKEKYNLIDNFNDDYFNINNNRSL